MHLADDAVDFVSKAGCIRSRIGIEREATNFRKNQHSIRYELDRPSPLPVFADAANLIQYSVQPNTIAKRKVLYGGNRTALIRPNVGILYVKFDFHVGQHKIMFEVSLLSASGTCANFPSVEIRFGISNGRIVLMNRDIGAGMHVRLRKQ